MWCIHNPESALENETHKLLQGFEIQTDPLNLSQTTRLRDSQQKEKEKRELGKYWTLPVSKINRKWNER